MVLPPTLHEFHGICFNPLDKRGRVGSFSKALQVVRHTCESRHLLPLADDPDLEGFRDIELRSHPLSPVFVKAGKRTGIVEVEIRDPEEDVVVQVVPVLHSQVIVRYRHLISATHEEMVGLILQKGIGD